MRALGRADMVIGDGVIGVQMFGDFDWVPPSVDLMSRKRFWHGSWLVIPPADGEAVHAPATVTRASDELAGLLGGPFDRDLAPFIRPLGNLVFRNPECPLPGFRERPFHDRRRVTYAWLASAFDRWRVQAIGAPDDFFFVSMFTALDENNAVDRGGFPRRHPMGEPGALLNRIAPAVGDRKLQPDTRYSSSEYDAVFTADRLRVRMGVRRLGSPDGKDTGKYLYAVRVDARVEAEWYGR